MINRVLIRIKVVQLLYSYLLTRSEFKIEKAVETSSADRRYSFEAYAELLLLILELSDRRINAEGAENQLVKRAIAGCKFVDSKLSSALMSNADVKALIATKGPQMAAYNLAVASIVEAIKASPNYKAYSKIKSPEAGDDLAFWLTALKTIARNEELEEAMRHNPEFTLRGKEMGMKMLENTLTNFSGTRSALLTARNDLARSFDAAYDLYFNLLLLPLKLIEAQEARLAANAAKYLPTDEDLNPDRRWVDGTLLARLAAHPTIADWKEAHNNLFDNDPILVEHLLDRVLQSDYYIDYMAAPGTKTPEDELELWRRLMQKVLLLDDDLLEAMENASLFWNDDLEVIAGFAIKTLRQCASEEDGNAPLYAQFKDEEDAQFGRQLFDNAVANLDEYRELIDEFVNVSRWDTDRLAMMDIVILRVALAEILTFPKIPLQVSVNEYVEIANWYSTQRAGSFVNGILGPICDKLRLQGRINKSFSKKLS